MSSRRWKCGAADAHAGVADRRLKHVTLTRAGLDLLDGIAEPARRAHARTIEALPEDERGRRSRRPWRGW
jgi:hypothetical protein